MKHRVINLTGVLVAVVLLCGAPAQAEQPLDNDSRVGHFLDNSNWSEVSTWLGTKEVIELADASIIIEVNSTDGDAGFQIFLDGDGLRRRCHS